MHQNSHLLKRKKIRKRVACPEEHANHMLSAYSQGRNVDIDEFLEFVVAFAYRRQGWCTSNILFKDIEDFAKIYHIQLRNHTKLEQNKFRVKVLIEDVKSHIIPKLRELYPDKMQKLLGEVKQRKILPPPLSEIKKSPRVEPRPIKTEQRQLKILEYVLSGGIDFSREDERSVATLGIDLSALRLNPPTSEIYQAQMIRIRQKLAFLKMKFSS
jgi:hypothetical protein